MCVSQISFVPPPPRLYGEAAAGRSGDSSALVLVNKLEAGAMASIAGRPAAAGAPSRSEQLMLMLEPGAEVAMYTVRGGGGFC
jgi:hypothetical protein